MRILLIEDEHRIANSIKKGLVQERYAVDVCYDGISGYDFSSSEDYDLIILDLMLPGMDGLTLLEKLRSKNVHTPVLILTAKGQIQDKVQGLDKGADDYLTKPFSFEELVARVRALIRRPKKSTGEILQISELKLNPSEFTVERSGKRIDLSSKEFALLEYFMHNPGKILTKTQIIDHVWNYDADILPNTVEVYIKNLRTKIDSAFENKKRLIKTVRGFGYKIE